jgi:pantoate--beta-alanine ligase
MKPEVIRAIRDLRFRVGAWRKETLVVGMVPTMGALHRGHLALIETAQNQCDRVIVTLFVNPTQFSPTEDLAAYPRDEEADRLKLEKLGADVLFAPSTAEMYPEGFDVEVTIGGPSKGLETDFRPNHFTGVATVVAKLLTAGLPDRAYFGEKDYQQLMVVKKLVRDLNLATEIVGCPTVREADGLAMSSRNAYLSAAERSKAPALYAALKDIAKRIRSGESSVDVVAAGSARLATEGFVVDYLELCDADTLVPVADVSARRLRLLVAAKLGKTRLIDNVEV